MKYTDNLNLLIPGREDLFSLDYYNTNFEKLDKEFEGLSVDKVSTLLYKSASVTIMTSYIANSDNIYKHLAYQGLNQTLIPMVGIVDKNDSSPTTLNIEYVEKAITDAASYGVSTVMIKPHLGINFYDNTERYKLTPSDPDLFFANWKSILLEYGKLCMKHNIPVLCIGCEQYNQTRMTYRDKWVDIVNTLKSNYPSLLLTYACVSTEGLVDNENAIFDLVDFIGLNVYLQWYKGDYNESLTYKDIMPSVYDSYAPKVNGFQVMKRISELAEKYNKGIYITECGVMPYEDALVSLKSSHASDSSYPMNFNVSAIWLEAMLNTLCFHKDVVGFSIWHVKSPFSYFDITTDTLGVSPAEEIAKKYFKGGIL